MIGLGIGRLVAAAVAWLALAGAAQAGAPGGIAGHVTEAGTGVPIAGVQVEFHEAGGGGMSSALTDGNGHFNSGPTLAPGSWQVRTLAPAHLDVLFGGAPCEGLCDFSPGTPVTVPPGITAVANFSLIPGAAVAGRVTGPGGVPLASAAVFVRRSTGEVVASGNTDGNGDYQTSRSLAAGNYHVNATTPFALVDELYPDQPCPAGNCALGAPGAVAVTTGNITNDIDFELEAGARLSGQVTEAAGGTPVANALVTVGRADGTSHMTIPTPPTGDWQTPALPPGDWRFFVSRTGALLGRPWSGAPCDIDCDLADSAPLLVSGSTPITGLDVALDAGAVFGGSVTAALGGAPVPDALVTVFDPARQGVIAVASSAPDGSYVTEAFLPGTVHLSAIAVDFLMSAHGANCEPACQQDSGAPIMATAGTLPGFNFALQTGGAISGTVSGPDGPLQGMHVVVLHPDGQAAGVVLTDAAGHYDTGTSLGSGDYRVRTANRVGLVDEAWPDLPCVGAVCEPTAGDLLAVTAGQTTVADFTLGAGARITGEVRRASDDTPIASPILRLTDESGLNYTFTGEPDGTFDTASGLPPGDYYLMASATDPALLAEAWEEQPCSACDALEGTPITVAGTGVVTGIDFTLDEGATLSGRVLDDGGLPLDGATVLVFDAQGQDILASGMTGADGRYTTFAFAPGEVLGWAQASGYLNAIPDGGACDGACSPDEGPLLQALGGELEDVDFTLRQGNQLTGHVLLPGGGAAAGVTVAASSNDHYVETAADGNGAYAFDGLPDGTYVIYALASGPYVATAWPSVQCVIECFPEARPVIVLDDEDRTGIDITLIEGGTVHGRVEGMPGNIAQPGTVEFYESASFQFAGSATLAGGEYTSDPLPPGDYLLFTDTSGGYIDEMFDDVPCPFNCDETLGAPVTVSAGGQATADFELAIGGRIAGRIFDAGTNAAFALRPTVQIRAADNTIVWSSTTLSNGNYTTTALPSGTYYVRSRNRSGFLDEFFLDEDCFWCVPAGGIAPDGLPAAPTPVAVTLGAITTNIDLGLVPARRLGGHVLIEPSDDGAELTLVRVYDVNGNLIVSVAVASDGSWLSLGGFAPGTYYLRTVNEGFYFDELYGGAICIGSCDVTQGTPVVLTAGADRTDLDFSLAPQPEVFADGFE